MRIALYHCCPVSRSKRSVAIYLLPCDSPYVTIFVYKMKEKCQLNWMWKTDFSLHIVLICRICWLRRKKKKKLSDVILQHHSVLLWTCMVFQSCCILSLLSFLFCNLYFQMQNLKDYFGYVHACVMFRMLISTKSCWVWNKSRLVLKIKCLTICSVATALLFISPFIHFIYRTVMYIFR